MSMRISQQAMACPASSMAFSPSRCMIALGAGLMLLLKRPKPGVEIMARTDIIVAAMSYRPSDPFAQHSPFRRRDPRHNPARRGLRAAR